MNRIKKVLCVALVLLLLAASAPAVPVADLGFGITASALNATGKCGKTATYTFDSATGKLTIEGTGKINAEAFYSNEDIKEVVIGDGITEIGADAFNNCDNLTTVDLGNTVTVIGDKVFFDCNNFTSVEIPDSVIIIDDNAFGNCDNLTNIVIPDSVETLGYSVFWDCNNLTSVVIGNGVKTIEGYAFNYCYNLTSVSVGSSVETIDHHAFYNCTSLESINIPKIVTSIGSEAFRYCPSLTDVYYEGAEENWNAINIREYNTALENAEIHFAETHTHTWDVEEITKYPTCTEKGEKTISCKGAVCKKVEELPMKEHDCYEWNRVYPTCTEKGYIEYHCHYCDYSYTEDVDAPGHSYYEKYIEPTCTKNGYTYYYCDNCGNSYTDKEELAKGHTPDATGNNCITCGEYLGCIHTYSAEKLITKTPTCTTEGQMAIVCSKCKANKPGSEEVIPATGHAWDEGEVIKAATCKEKGSMKHKCNNMCGETKTEEIAVVPHNYKEEITHATCTEDGYSTFTCTMCGSHYVDKPVEAYGHMFDIYFYDEGSATCYWDGTKTAECANGCGTKNTIADPGTKKNHEMTDFTVITPATCTEDGVEIAKCFYYDKCGYSEFVPVDALGHDIAADYTVDVPPTCEKEGSQSKHCSRCDYKDVVIVIPSSGHDMQPGEGTTATCTEPGKAKFICANGCGHIIEEANVPALGHTFNYTSNGDATCQADGTKTGKCIRCDVTETVVDMGSILEHKLGSPKYVDVTCTTDGLMERKCVNCDYAESKYIPALGHDYEEVYEEQPTCTQDGYFEYACTRCGDWYSETVESYGHDFDYIEDFASCTEDGYYEYYCVICGYSESGVIEAYGHTYPDQWSVIIPATCKETGVAVKVCFDCHEVIAMVVPKAGHADLDGDSKCDTCEMIIVVEPEEPTDPDTPNEPEEKPCDCDCHAGGIKAFFFKLINFFAKIFDKSARVCKCGASH